MITIESLDRKIDATADRLENKIDHLDVRTSRLEEKSDRIEAKVDGLEVKFDGLEQTVEKIAIAVVNLTETVTVMQGDVAEIKRSQAESYGRMDQFLTIMKRHDEEIVSLRSASLRHEERLEKLERV